METAHDRQMRDKLIIEDYNSGKDLAELSRTYGLTDRRISQILTQNEITLRPRRRAAEREPISRIHERIGVALIDYRFENDIQPNQAANDLGWGYRKLQAIEAGVREIELLDLLDIASYTNTPLEKLTSHG